MFVLGMKNNEKSTAQSYNFAFYFHTFLGDQKLFGSVGLNVFNLLGTRAVEFELT